MQLEKNQNINLKIILFIIILNLILCYTQNISVLLGTFFSVAAIAFIFALVIFYYKNQLNNINTSLERQFFCKKIIYTLSNFFIFLVISLILAIFSYLVATFNFPFQDKIFDKYDKILGFYWYDWFDYIKNNKVIGFILYYSYSSIILQMIVIIILLGLNGHFKQFDKFIFLYATSGFIAIILSGIFPALAIYHHYNISPEVIKNAYIVAPYDHIDDVLKLRSGVINFLPPEGSFKGIITFPSFHASLGVIFIIVTLNLAYIRWFFIILNILMILATPFNGGHYFVDVIAGIVIVLVMNFIANKILDLESNQCVKIS